jgi:hypothetical protein
MGLYELIDYLVRLKLADHKKALCVLTLTIQGEPVSSITEKCDVYKNEARGYLARVREKIGNSNKAYIILKHVLPLLCDVKPLIINNVCTLCNKNLYYPQASMTHLLHRHRDIVKKYNDMIIEKLKLFVQS